MKNLYPKGKGKIHPSPAVPPSAGGSSGGPSSPSHDALTVLKLLPAAILALTAALTDEDKEVLAYLITRSIHGPAAAAVTPLPGTERRRCRGPGVAHRPLFDCGCFDCYTSFWSRWDCSPDHELIHQAIEAFEEHLASSEKKGGRARRRDRRAVDRADKGKEKEKEKEKAKEREQRKAMEAEVAVIEEEKLLEGQPSVASEAASLSGEIKEAEAAADAGCEDGSSEETAVGGEKRRGWPDVMGLFNSRFWSLWGPAV